MRDDADLTTDAGDPPARLTGARIRHLDLELLSLHIDGALDSGERGDAEVHLAECAECHLDYTELRMTVSLLQGLPQYEPRKSFVLGPEYGKVKRRPIQAPRPQAAPDRPASPYLPPPPPLPHHPWFESLLPGATALKVASGLVGVALLISIAGDALTPDAAPRQGLAMRPAQMATSILPPGSQVVRTAPDSAPADPTNSVAPAPAGVTETLAPALQQENGAPATVAATVRPSWWRIAQVSLAMLLLWLLVSLAGRIWVDRHESLTA
jgi:hypothetical protein